MSIKQKLVLMGTLMALLVVSICGIGYYTAQTSLMASISEELEASLSVQAAKVDGWLAKRGQIAESTATLLSMYADRPELYEQNMLSLAANDKDVLDICHGTEDSRFIRWAEGDVSALVNPHQRKWYNDAKAKGKLFYTEAYEDISNHQTVVSAAVPYNGNNGAVRGAVCVDISLATLDTRVKNLKYHGEGEGIIIEPSGLIIASSEGMAMHNVEENPVLKENFSAMLQNKNGYFATEKDGEQQIIAYTTVPSSGWIVAIAVPERVVFAQLANLKMTYTGMSVLGILLVAGIIIALLRFAATITGATERLMNHVDALAKGDLSQPDLPVASQDELGQLAANFNTMMKNIRGVIRQVAETAEQLAAASEQLTAGAHQMAESATEIAGTVSHVADGTGRQRESIADAKQNIGSVSDDVGRVTDKAARVAAGSASTAEAAEKGEALMNDAMQKMTGIEQSVLRSAEVVEKLGESSKQIGEIVETISAIADQTNLLALNAAIEAARAGETGRGFAVVAEEVRKLAEQSREAADQIKERITGVQHDTAQAVAAMQSGTSEVQEGTAAIRAVGTQFENITRMVDEMKEQIANISSSMQTVAEGTERIIQSATMVDTITEETAENMQNISSSSESQSASSEEIASASQSLATLATDLQNATHKFKL
ncbi:methyl-accepting chemotaxis protein [Selenomonas dianae]|uniref:Methyl-accepting chemotaxis sensory transducer with Cache sensor n=1 Tax=Selenomonas dianae TaxID=135079 RepID=A0ABP3CS13_9FIRM|nr:methyl-accepting chemotaxis protein [Selenomonas dianae]WLD82500.1 methyl-accepting chemotaxis protein [Selenomonas dianae]